MKNIAALPRYVLVDIVGILEFIAIFLCAIISKLFYVDWHLGGDPSHFSYLMASLAGSMLCYFVMRQQDHYNPFKIINRPQQTRRIFLSLGLSFITLVFMAYMLDIRYDYSRGWLITWFAISFLTVSLMRGQAIAFLSTMAHEGKFNKHVILFGEENLCRKLEEYSNSRYVEAEIVGVYGLEKTEIEQRIPSSKVCDKLNEVVASCKKHAVDQVIVALPCHTEISIQDILLELGQVATYVDFCPSELVFRLRSPGFYRIGEIGLYNLQKAPLTIWGLFAKRVMDLMIAVPSIILLSPAMLVIVIIIKVTTRGDALFVQERHGLHGRIIQVLKFRTMVVAEKGDIATQADINDNRVTVIGRFLRRTSLDELPQLINVIKGEMSLVGPRPHPIKLNQDFIDIVDKSERVERMERYMSRHKVKPGITGWAQVNGYRGPTDTREKMANRFKHDLYYVNNWSIWLDLRVLRMTVMAVLKGDNAI